MLLQEAIACDKINNVKALKWITNQWVNLHYASVNILCMCMKQCNPVLQFHVQ